MKRLGSHHIKSLEVRTGPSGTTTKVAFHLSVLAGRKELVLISLNGKVQGARVHFPATTLQIPALWPTGAGELSGPDP